MTTRAAAPGLRPEATPIESPFAGFWMGGYEGADHVNAAGMPLDMTAASGHLMHLEADHARAAEAGLRSVRASIGWRLAEGVDGRFDFSRARRIARSAQRHGLQVLWTVMHYGLPPDLSLHDDALIDRYARFSAEVARVIGDLSPEPPVYTPINEISYLAWGSSQPDLFAAPNHTVGGDPDSSRESGYAVKRRLVRACLAGMDAMRRIDPRARFLQVEPVVHVVTPVDRPDLADLATQIRDYQWQAWDLMAGHAEPELGGHAGAIDLLGVNHYHSSQWEVGTERRLAWHLRDPRRMRLSALLDEVWQRYARPVVLAETGHLGVGRAAWLNDVAGEVRQARQAGVPVLGVCLYPLVDRPDWNDPARWHRSALWHVDPDPAAEPPLARTVDRPLLAALRRWQASEAGDAVPPGGSLLVLGERGWESQGHALAPLLSRLAGRWRIVYLEPPRHAIGAPRLDTVAHGPDLEVVVPWLEAPDVGPHPEYQTRATLRRLLGDWWLARQLGAAVVWPRDPAVCWLADGIDVQAWLPAPAALNAGSAWRAVGVEPAAFSERPCGWEAEEARRLDANIGHPRIGVAGGLDGRIDLALLDGMAASRTDWHFVITAPPPDATHTPPPRRPNLHWLGAVPDRVLPALMADWKVGLLPLTGTAMGEPAQAAALQMMSAGLPIVASRLVDVPATPAALVDGLTRVGPGVSDHLAAIEAALAEAPLARVARRARARIALVDSSWDALAGRAHRQLLALRARSDPARAGSISAGSRR